MTRAPEFAFRLPGRSWWMNSGWLLADRIVRIVLGLLLNVILARVYGPAGYGGFAYALTVAALLLPLSACGLERIVVRDLARDPAAEPAVLATAVLIRLVAGGTCWLLAVAGMAAMRAAGEEGTVVLVMLVAAGNVWNAFDVVDWSFQARGDFRTVTVWRLVAFLAGLAAKLGFALARWPLEWVAAVVAVETLLAGGLQVWRWRRAGGRFAALAWSAERAGHLLRAGLPLLGADVAVWLFQRFDVVLLGRTGDAHAVGLYSIAQRLATAGFFLPGIVVQLFSPAVAQAAVPQAALAIVQRCMDALVLVAYALALGLSLGAGFWIERLFGAAYREAAPLLALLAWSNVFVFMGAAHGLYLINRGEQRLLFGLAWFTAAASVTGNFLLIPGWGAMGAALANVVAYAATTVLAVGLFRGSRPLLAVNFRALAAPVLYPARWLRGALARS